MLARRPRPRAAVAAAASLGALLASACGVPVERFPVAPGVTFAAHEVHAGLMVDAMHGGEPTVLAPVHWLRLPGQAAFVVVGGPARGEGIWLAGPGGAVVRRSTARDAPVVGRVEPSWDDDAIRITIAPAGGRPIRSDVFAREDVGGGVSVLSRLAQLSIDLGGTYRATLRAPDGSPVGWVRLRLGPRAPSPATYEAVLPDDLDEALAAACAVALGSEIDRIEAQAYDVYRGSWVGD